MQNACKVLIFALAMVALCTSNVSGAPIDRNVMSIPIVFEKNMGQAPMSYQFLSRHGGVETLFSEAGVDIVLQNRLGAPDRISFRLVGVRPNVFPEGRNQLPSVTNYLLGADPSRWMRGVLNIAQVVYSGIYPGIDLVFHGNNTEMEHDFRVAPGADPNQVRFSIEGVQRITIDSSDNLEISLNHEKLIFRRPTAYQESSRGRTVIESGFVLNLDGSIRFRLGAYDRTRELIIDPVFVFSTYLAGNTADYPAAVTTDSTGNVYVTGYTYSSNFPIKNGVQTTSSGSPDAFVSKLDPTGQSLLYSTYLGGSSRNYGNAITVDTKGNIIVAGTSASNDFPHAGSVPATTCTGNNDCFFLASLNPDGASFNYAGLIGGIAGTAVQSGESGSGSLAVDAAGNAYLTSVTDSSAFEITAGTLATSVPGYPYNSTFVLKVNPTGALVYSTIIPGTAPANTVTYLNDVFVPAGISVNANGEATIAGTSGPGLPTTAGVMQPTFPNNLSVENASAGFVLELNASASAITYATYVPGTDTIGGLAVDSQGNSYVTGGTSETNLPVSSDAYQKMPKAGCTCDTGFLLKLNGQGTKVLAATYLGGTPVDNQGTSFSGIALDSNSNVFVGGMTASTDFPLLDPFIALLETGDTLSDMVLAEMSPDLSALLFGSFLSSTDQIFAGSTFSALTVDSENDLVVAAISSATDFPTTPDSFQPTPPSQAFHPVIVRLDMATPAPSVCLDNWYVNFGSVTAKTSGTKTLHLTNCGNAILSITSLVSSSASVTVKDSCESVNAGAVCPLTLTFAPPDNAAVTGTLTLKDDAVISPQVISFSGQGVAPELNPSSGSFNFGHLLVNTKGAGNTFTFSNTGNASLSITAVSVDGDFAITKDFCIGSLQPSYVCLITITFSPTAAGIRTGTLTIISNDPVNPQAGISLVGVGDSVYAVPVITSLGSPTAQINNSPITLQVMGANFYPASVIQVNGTSEPTTYSSGGQIQATLTSSVTGSVGEVSVTVANPTPGGGTSVAIPLTLYQGLNIGAAFVASVPGSELIYASIPSSATANPNTVIPINPATGALGKPIPVGHNPDLLAASSDGSYLFVVAEQDQTLQRINLSTQSVDQTYPFPPNNTNCCGTPSGTDLRGVPGSPQEVVLAVGVPAYTVGEMALYNDSGLVNYVPTSSVGTVSFSSFAFAGSPLAIYSLPFTNASTPFFNVITISSQGLQFTPYQGTNYGGNNTTGAQVVSDGTLLYTVSGEIWNPATQTEVGTFPVTLDNATSYPNLEDLLMDVPSGQLFSVGDEPYQVDSDALTLSAYGQESHKLNGALAFPDLANVVLVRSLVRWGSNGFAFMSYGAPAGGIVYLLTSGLATSLSSNPLPSLISVTPSSLPKGSSNSQLTLNGSGFTTGSVVMWSKTALQTTYTASTVLTALVPSADLANSGTASVTVSNPTPGGGTSSAVSFTITPLAPLVSFSSSAIVFSSQKVGTSSATQIVAVQNPGTAALAISAISISGAGAESFTQTNTCGSTLAAGANCSISVIFKPAAGGLQSASITIADNASGSPQALAISGSGLSLGLAVASGTSSSATVAAGATANYSLTIGGAGVAGTVTITCTGAPKGADCSVPSSVSPNAASASSLTVTVTTTSRTSAALLPEHLKWQWAVMVFAGVILTCSPRMRPVSRRFRGWPLLLLILICSCGGGGSSSSGTQENPNGTPAGQYTLTVTASGQSYSQSLPLTLIVQ